MGTIGPSSFLLRPLTAADSAIRDLLACETVGQCQRFLDDHLWRHLAHVYGSPRVVRRGEVDPNSGVRHSGFRLLWWSREVYALDTAGPGSPCWITVTEQGIRQSFDLTRVMFSRGNITEKIRFGKLVQQGEMVLGFICWYWLL